MPAISAPDLVKLRAQPHAAKLGFVIVNPDTVMTARVNDAGIAQGARVITYDTGSGAWASVQAGMTLWVGSAANTYDIGRVRVISASATQLTIAQNSDIAWADNLYLTVKNEYLPWPKFVRISGTTVYKDYDVAYANQTITWHPVPVLGGPAVAVIPTAGGSASVYFDGSESYTVDGSTITGYAWTFPSGTAGPGATTAATPGNVVWTAPGVYQVVCTVTASNGRTTTGHRTVVIVGYGAMNGNFALDSLSGTIEEGFTLNLRVYDTTPANVPDHAQVLVYEVATFAGTAGSVGAEANRANIKFAGYVTEGSVRVDPLTNDVTFAASSVYGLMQRQFGWPTFVEDKATATNWNQAQDLDMNRAYHYLIYWHTTLMEVADVLIESDTTLIKVANFPQGTPWGMIKDFAFSARMSRVGVSKGGRILLRRDPQYLAVASRGTIAEFFTLQASDWQGELQIPELFTPSMAWVDLSGVFYSGVPTTDLQPFFSKAPSSDNPKYYGGTEEVQYLVLNSQSEANVFSGMVLAQRNNACPELSLALAGNWSSAVDPAYQEYVRMPLAGFDTKRGFVLVNARLLVRGQSISYDAAGGVLTTELRLELETSGQAGAAYVLPPETPPPTELCPPGTVWNPDTQQCEAIVTCPPGTVWNPNTNQCDTVTGPSWRSHILLSFANAGIYEATDVTPPTDALQPTWNAINTGLDSLNVIMMIGDPWEPGVRQYALTGTGIHRRENSGNWVKLLDVSFVGDVSQSFVTIFCSINTQGYVGVYISEGGFAGSNNLYHVYSLDHGDTWAPLIPILIGAPGTFVNASITANAQWDLIGAYKGSSTYGAGQVLFAPAYQDGAGPQARLLRSTNRGIAWSIVQTIYDFEDVRFHIDPGSQDACLIVGRGNGYGTLDGIKQSTDHGTTFSAASLTGNICNATRYGTSIIFNPAGQATAWRQAGYGASKDRLYLTIDSGASYGYGVFSALPTLAPVTTQPFGLSIVMDSPNFLYLMAERDANAATDPVFFEAEDVVGADGYAITVVDKSGSGGTKLPGTGGGITSILQVWM